MSFVSLGLTHCRECLRPIPMNCFKCPYCEGKKKQEKESKINDLLEIFLNMSDDELEGLKCLITEKGKEIRRKRCKELMEKLEKELEE